VSKLALVFAFVALLLGGCGESEEANDGIHRGGRMERQAQRHRAAMHRARMRQRARIAARQRRQVMAARRHRMHVRAEAARRHAAEEAEAEELAAQEASAEATAEEEARECDPNYVGACLDPNVSDYDCEGGSGDGPMYTGTVTVVGEDHYGLDSDSDGTGCEAN